VTLQPLPPAAEPQAASGAAGTLPSWLQPLLAQGWGRKVLLAGAGLVLLDATTHWLPGEGGGLLLLGGLAGGWWWLSGSRRPITPKLPVSLEGWITRCQQVLAAFERLDPDGLEAQQQRRQTLQALEQAQQRSQLQLALLGTDGLDPQHQPQLVQGLRGARGLELAWSHRLPLAGSNRQWPQEFLGCDAFLYRLTLPLSAADLRWLEAVPAGMPLWLLVEGPPGPGNGAQAADQALLELADQWPALDRRRLLLWDGAPASLATSVRPLGQWLSQQAPALRAATPRRCFEQLHGAWQAELEGLRRQQWQQLQQRTQWIVAAGVVAAPLPSLDLLVLAIANGLMLQDMAKLWECPWSSDQLKAAAQELGRAALAQGVVEWSSQALAGAIKLHGATWLVGGALQALSAAYLTRVVGRAMADVLALSAGVSAPDLERIKREAPLLVAQAAASEKLDWAGFLQQGRRWFEEQGRAATA